MSTMIHRDEDMKMLICEDLFSRLNQALTLSLEPRGHKAAFCSVMLVSFKVLRAAFFALAEAA